MTLKDDFRVLILMERSKLEKRAVRDQVGKGCRG